MTAEGGSLYHTEAIETGCWSLVGRAEMTDLLQSAVRPAPAGRQNRPPVAGKTGNHHLNKTAVPLLERHHRRGVEACDNARQVGASKA